MKVIETKYNGIKFRSRLEARWAVYFDELGIKYIYEMEGFHFDNGMNYLPDFYLPQIDSWAEVKPKLPDEEEKEKCKLLAKGTEKDVIILDGVPEAKNYYCYSFDIPGDGTLFLTDVLFEDLNKYWEIENRLFTSTGAIDDGMSSERFILSSPAFPGALSKAKNERFEND